MKKKYNITHRGVNEFKHYLMSDCGTIIKEAVSRVNKCKAYVVRPYDNRYSLIDSNKKYRKFWANTIKDKIFEPCDLFVLNSSEFKRPK